MSNFPGIALMLDILANPLWLVAWMLWMGVVNCGAVLFWQDRVARITLAAFAGSFTLMSSLHWLLGYERILGLAHVVFWTPLVLYLWRHRNDTFKLSGTGRWLMVVVYTNSLSLIIDYIDVVRYLVER